MTDTPAGQVTADTLGNHPLDGTGETTPTDHELFEEVNICTIRTPMPVGEFVKLCKAIDKAFGGDTFLRSKELGEPDIWVRRRVR